jgi:hypothetical protein
LRIVIQEFTVIEVIKGDPTAIYNVLADAVDKKSSFQWTLPDNHKFFLNTRVNHLLDLAQAQARAFQEKVYQENLLKEAAYEMVLQHPVASQCVSLSPPRVVPGPSGSWLGILRVVSQLHFPPTEIGQDHSKQGPYHGNFYY